MTTLDPYYELELTRFATTEQIKTKYRQLAQEHHPDKGGDKDRFIRIKLSYEILIDPVRRKEYDETGRTEPKIDNVKVDATNEIAAMVFDLLNQINPEADDMIVIMRRELVNRKKAIIEQQQDCHRHIAHLSKFITRIKIKTDSENMIAGFVNTRLEQRKTDLEQMKHRNNVIDHAQKILADYHYGLEVIANITGAPTEN